MAKLVESLFTTALQCGCEFRSCFSNLNIKYHACFELEVPSYYAENKQWIKFICNTPLMDFFLAIDSLQKKSTLFLFFCEWKSGFLPSPDITRCNRWDDSSFGTVTCYHLIISVTGFVYVKKTFYHLMHSIIFDYKMEWSEFLKNFLTNDFA